MCVGEVWVSGEASEMMQPEYVFTIPFVVGGGAVVWVVEVFAMCSGK